MNVLVLGGTAFMGPFVVRRLVGWGHQVTVVHRGRTEADLPASVRHVHVKAEGLGDRAWLRDHREDLRRLRPDVVLDMMALTEADARELVAAFRGAAGRLAVVSSADVYRAYDVFRGVEPPPPDPWPLTEDSPLRPRLYPYRQDLPRPLDDPMLWADDYDKILVERAAMSDPELPAAVLRLPMVYGPGDRQHRLWPYLRAMADKRPTLLLGPGMAGWRAPRGYVENVGEAIALAVADGRSAGRTYNAADTYQPSEAEWVRAIAEVIGWAGRVVEVPEAVLHAVDRLPEHLSEPCNPDQGLALDSSRLRAELEYREPTPPEEALRRTVEWELAHPPGGGAPEADYEAEDALLEDLRRRGVLN